MNMKQILYIDMDNVLVDFQSGIDSLDEELRAEYEGEYDTVPGIFSKMAPMKDAVDAFNTLSGRFDVYILSTSPWDNPSAWCDKLEWVKKNLGENAYKRLILTHHKELAKGDYLIDDRTKNGASEFEGELIQFGTDKYPDWHSVVDYLLNKDSLRGRLESFNPSNDKKKLTEIFHELAPKFLYGGYLQVGTRFRVYIRTVEFYFHAEDGSEYSAIKDPIVYHRNNKSIEGEIPYFPMMAIHAHDSGFDITFENEDKKYRASVLIRAYEIYDNEQKQFLVYDTDSKVQKFVEWKCSKQYNNQVTYLKKILNGFETHNVKWIDEQRELPINDPCTQTWRKNVFESTDEHVYVPRKGENDKNIQDQRRWSFSRTIDITL